MGQQKIFRQIDFRIFGHEKDNNEKIIDDRMMHDGPKKGVGI